MNYHSNIPANRAAVNQEKLIRQVAGHPAARFWSRATSNFCRGQRARLQVAARGLVQEKIPRLIRTCARPC